MSEAASTPPSVRKGPVRFEKFGRVFVDDYAWLRDVDWFDRLRTPERLNPEIRALLQAENAYCDAVLAPTQALQAQMVEEILSRSTLPPCWIGAAKPTAATSCTPPTYSPCCSSARCAA